MSEIADVCEELEEAYAEVLALLWAAVPHGTGDIGFMRLREDAYHEVADKGQRGQKGPFPFFKEVFFTCDYPRTVLKIFVNTRAIGEFEFHARRELSIGKQPDITVQNMLKQGSGLTYQSIEHRTEPSYGFRYPFGNSYYIMADAEQAKTPVERQTVLLEGIGTYAKDKRFIDDEEVDAVIERAKKAVRAADKKLPPIGQEVPMAKGSAPRLEHIVKKHGGNEDEVAPVCYKDERVTVLLGRYDDTKKAFPGVKIAKAIKKIEPQAVISEENETVQKDEKGFVTERYVDLLVTLPAHVYEQAFGGTGLEGLKHAPGVDASKGGGRGGRGGKR